MHQPHHFPENDDNPYKGRMGGDPTRGGMVFGDWMSAGPGTVGGGVTKAVCNRS